MSEKKENQNKEKSEKVNEQAVPEEENKKPEKKELNPDKFLDLAKIINREEDVTNLKPVLYRHILKIASRNKVNDKYHILFLYEPNDSIQQGMVDRIYNAIPDDNKKPILLVIHNHGGRIEPAYLISKTCKELSPHFVVAIPRKAKSAATLLALGGNEIQWDQ